MKCRSGYVDVGGRCVKAKPISFSDKTTIPLVDYPEKFGRKPSVINWMSPDDYLYTIGVAQLPNAIEENQGEWKKRLMGLKTREDVIGWQIELATQPVVDRIKRSILKEGRLRELPILSYDMRSQEGRHRMVALKQLGIRSVPVVFADW